MDVEIDSQATAERIAAEAIHAAEMSAAAKKAREARKDGRV